MVDLTHFLPYRMLFTYHIVNKIVRDTAVIRLLSLSPHTKSIVILFYIFSGYTQGATYRRAFTFCFQYKGMRAASIYFALFGHTLYHRLLS